MTILQRHKSPKEHRLDHEKFGDVYQANFSEGVIEDFGLLSEDPLAFDDTCRVRLVSGAVFDNVPIFYHCRKGFYDDEVSMVRDKALNHAAWAFRVGQKVKVMLNGNEALAVLGHQEAPVYYPSDGSPRAPRPCLDIFRLAWHKTIGDQTENVQPPISPVQDWWLNWFGYSAKFYTMHYRASSQEEVTEIDEPYVEPNGYMVELPHRMKHIMGMRELTFGTVVYYIGDWLIVIGPAAYIFNVYAIGMPGPLTGSVRVMGAVYSKEREEAWLNEARAREELYRPTGIWTYPNPSLMNYVYSNMTIQTKFTKTFHDRFVLQNDEPQWRPKWIVSEFWGYDWDRAATDGTTPNTIDG